MSWAQILYLKKHIDGKKVFVGGISPVLKTITTSVTVNNNQDLPIKFTSKLNGTLSVVFQVANGTNSTQARIHVLNNLGNVVASATIGESSIDVQRVLNFNVIKDTTYTIRVGSSNSNYSVTFNNIYIGGQVTDSNYYK